jgi:hypothetical protein
MRWLYRNTLCRAISNERPLRVLGDVVTDNRGERRAVDHLKPACCWTRSLAQSMNAETAPILRPGRSTGPFYD